MLCAVTNQTQAIVVGMACTALFIIATSLILYTGVRDGNSYSSIVETDRIGHETLNVLLRQIRDRDDKAMVADREMYRAKIDAIQLEQSMQLTEIKQMLQSCQQPKN